MDKFIVSARKYRPQDFATMVGQMHITTTLKNAIKNEQLAHAFLFCGPRGVGKTTCARILAKTINCTNLQPDGEACNTCVSCTSFNDGASLNIHELDAASNNSVDDIRTLVEQVRFAPQAGKYKVYIIDEVHMLSSSAFNAFLKTLEEPPPFAIFILATTEKHKILPTILSRCQIFDFKRITLNDTVQHLQEIVVKEEINAEKSALQLIAQKSEGCMRDALSILDKLVSFTNGQVSYTNTVENLNILDHEYYFKLLEFLSQQDLASALLLFDEINNKGFEGDLVLNGFAEFLRNVLVCKNERAAVLLDVIEGLQEKYATISKKTDIAFIVSALNILNEAEMNFKLARNKRLHIELTIIKLNYLQQALELTSKEDGTLIKKKRLNDSIAIHYKELPKKVVQKEKDEKIVPPKLLIDEPEKVKAVSNPKALLVKEEKTDYPSSPSLQKIQEEKAINKSLLDILREKAGKEYRVIEIEESESLELEKLQQCWNNYITQMEELGGKNSVVNTFKMAKLEVVNELSFCVNVNAVIQQKFIEQEKVYISELIQKSFKNSAINFSINIVEGEKIELSQQLSLNSKDRFELIASNYPMVRQLKNRLRLDVEYS